MLLKVVKLLFFVTATSSISPEEELHGVKYEKNLKHSRKDKTLTIFTDTGTQTTAKRAKF